MKTRHSREISLMRRMVLGSLLFLLCVIGVTSYNVLGGSQLFQTRSYNVSQLSADARTVAAALSYLLEPEPLDVGTNTLTRWNVG
jgi:hypothetical protein